MNNDDKMVTIIREDDKLTILEKWLNNDYELETIVSKYIDCCIQNDQSNKMKCFHQIKTKVLDLTLLAKIIKISSSIAFQSPYQMSVDDTQVYNKLVDYVNKPYVDFIPNFSFPEFS